MKTKKFKNLTFGFALLLAVVAMSSCNRGVGCPSEFSLDKEVTETVINVIEAGAKSILK
jgi:hypothetical protein